MILGTGTGSAQAQGLFNKIKNKVKEKVEQKIDNAIDKAVNGAVDGATNAAKGAVNGSSEDYDPVANPAGAPSTQSQAPATADVSNVKSDFVPGSIVVFEDKVSGEQVGEFPSKWDL